MIQPTVGRIVHYYSFKVDGSIEMAQNGMPLAAIITRVWEPGKRVNLTVFDAKGDSYGRTGIPLIQPGSERPVGEKFCEWMPYQVKKETGSESGGLVAGAQMI